MLKEAAERIETAAREYPPNDPTPIKLKLERMGLTDTEVRQFFTRRSLTNLMGVIREGRGLDVAVLLAAMDGFFLGYELRRMQEEKK